MLDQNGVGVLSKHIQKVTNYMMKDHSDPRPCSYFCQYSESYTLLDPVSVHDWVFPGPVSPHSNHYNMIPEDADN